MRAASRPAASGPDRHGKSRGQSFVEFALVAPVLLLILLITLDFGRLFMSYVTLNNVTRVAANFGALSPANFTGTPNTTTYDSLVAREAAGLNCPIQPAGTPSHNPPIPTYPGGTNLGDDAVVQMTCSFTPLTPLISAFFGGPFPITSETRFPIRSGAIANISGSSTLPPPGAPFADFSFTGVTGGTVDGAGNVTGTDPVTVTVLDNSANAQTYDWNWGDGSTHDFTAAPLPHTYTGTQLYTLTLTITNGQGSAQHSQTVDLRLNPTPTPTATASATPVPPPVLGFYGDPVGSAPQVTGGGPAGAAIFGSMPSTNVNFTNQTTNATAYSWTFGDGTSPSTATNPSHTYAARGIFTVTLTVTTPTGFSPFARSQYVTIGCVAPTFAQQQTSAAAGLWSTAGFNGTLRYKLKGSNGNGSTTPPSPSKVIESQTGVVGGQFYPPTRQGQNYDCDYDVTVIYLP